MAFVNKILIKLFCVAKEHCSGLVRVRTLLHDPVQGSTCMYASIVNFVAIPLFNVVQQRMTQAYMGE